MFQVLGLELHHEDKHLLPPAAQQRSVLLRKLGLQDIRRLDLRVGRREKHPERGWGDLCSFSSAAARSEVLEEKDPGGSGQHTNYCPQRGKACSRAGAGG